MGTHLLKPRQVVHYTPPSFEIKVYDEYLIKRNEEALHEVVFIIDDGNTVEFQSAIKPFTEAVQRGQMIQWIKRGRESRPNYISEMLNLF